MVQAVMLDKIHVQFCNTVEFYIFTSCDWKKALPHKKASLQVKLQYSQSHFSQIRTQVKCRNSAGNDEKTSLLDSGSQTFSDRVPFVAIVLPPHTTLFQENSIYQISFDQKFEETELTQM